MKASLWYQPRVCAHVFCHWDAIYVAILLRKCLAPNVEVHLLKWLNTLIRFWCTMYRRRWGICINTIVLNIASTWGCQILRTPRSSCSPEPPVCIIIADMLYCLLTYFTSPSMLLYIGIRCYKYIPRERYTSLLTSLARFRPLIIHLIQKLWGRMYDDS